MDNFFFNDQFYSDLTDLCEYEGWEKEDIELYDEDFKLEVYGSILEPIFQLDAEWITERIDEERFSEDGVDNEISKLTKLLESNIDFEKINSQIQKMYYSNRKKHYFTKADLLEAVS
jgi:hypothetical protein